MKRSALVVFTAGMILAGAGAVEILGDNSDGGNTPAHTNAPAAAHGDLKPLHER
ncbi:hypothetical protein KO481_20745 [Nocardia sp. NEAU-G5]|uniref:Uncharacterized protein n=1 Tax=Nocardia albiluteola TaxID=2842303 RepID=A0ABS6B0X7_9NOCA|nr:hypothetical protein [Nocardia albiluteola]MBU3063948.1 hypothetical protein [Nocardia albiluteola]